MAKRTFLNHQSYLTFQRFQFVPVTFTELLSMISSIGAWFETEECGRLRIVYKKIAEGKHQYVVNGFKQDKFNFDQPNEDIVIVHYDIETHTRSGPDSMKLHIPYIVGFVDNESNTFKL